jgi:hypothetical protein
MKMAKEHYETLRAAMTECYKQHKDECNEHKAKHNEERYAWDMFHCVIGSGNIPDDRDLGSFFNRLYRYLDDSHIETAIFKIVKEMEV